MRNLLSLLYILLFTSLAFTQKLPSLKTGRWIGKLHLTAKETLPFNLEILEENDAYAAKIINGVEIIHVEKLTFINDSFHILFPVFNTEIIFKPTDKKTIKGYWVDHNKKDYSIDFSGISSKGTRFPKQKEVPTSNYSGKWETYFSKNGLDAYPALGIFNQTGEKISGTFLTETGDYRYLDGNVFANKLYLSCFDGSHAFLFTALENEKGELDGKFYSGKHWNSEWKANKNEEYSLPDPYSITYMKENTPTLSFTAKDLKGNSYSYPNKNSQGKVVIIQLMGTWCPNCLDETNYYKQLYEQYHSEGLEIISICYEAGDDFNKHVERVSTFKDKLDLGFTFLVGGSASKNIASQQFSELNEVVSFPTSIFIGRDGQIRRIHTGFNGPGTGVYYDEYVQKTNELIKLLIAE